MQYNIYEFKSNERVTTVTGDETTATNYCIHRYITSGGRMSFYYRPILD